METIPNSRFITIINNINGSIINKLELNDIFYDILNLFLVKYRGSNEDYAKLICNDKIINSINIFKINKDFNMPDDTDIIYMVKSYKKNVYIITDDDKYILINDLDCDLYYDNYYYMLLCFPNIITSGQLIKYSHKELILFLLDGINEGIYNDLQVKVISDHIRGVIYLANYDDYDFMLRICTQFKGMYSHISDKLKNNEEFILNLIIQNPNILEYVNSDMKNNYNIVLAAVNINSLTLRHACINMRNNYDIVLTAINNYSLSLQYASANLQNNYNIVLTAVKKYGISLQYASANMRNNYNIVLKAVKHCGLALQYASVRLQDNYNIVLAAVNQNHSSIQYASDRLKKIIKT